MQLLSLTGILTSRKSKQHIAHPFTVPEGTTRLMVRFTYGPEKVADQPGRNLLSLSLFDPKSSRGAGHNRADNNINLSAAYATPGYTPGPLPPGVWTVVIDTHMILPGGDVTYTLAVEVSSDPITEPGPHYVKGNTPPRGPGWYRGDLHSHTIHSDGKWDVPDLVAAARAEGLDFMTLTDHNTVAPLPQMDSLSTLDLLTMGGIELTTYSGHALALGVRQWIDWRVNPPDGNHRSMRDIAAAVEAAGGLFVIAHPMSPGDPICTGCDWQYPDMMPGTARLVEIWNGGWQDFNEDGLALWYQWLNQGHRLRATSGSDTHHPPLRREPAGFNIVYAEALTETAILKAIEQGHSYLSIDNARLTLMAKVQQNGEAVSGMMGDELSGSQAEVTVTWNKPDPGDRLRFIVDGTLCDEFTPEDAGTKSWTLPIAKAIWCVLEWRNRNGQMRAITNPIFFDPATL